MNPYSSIAEISSWIRNGTYSPVEVVEVFLDRIHQYDPQLHAFITVVDDLAKQEAAKKEVTIAQQVDPGWLLGIPVAIKDSIPTSEIRTTYNSRVFENYVPKTDGAVVRKLREAGAIILGKLNLSELEYSIPSEEDLYPPPCNPWNLKYATIGSSSGAGTAVAAGLCVAALGTDSGGSVRLPAGQCNLVGLKPTLGLVSRYGVYRSPVGEIGILARSVEDSAVVLKTLAGHDPRDLTSENIPIPDYQSKLAEAVDLSQLRLAIPWDYITSIPVESGVEKSFQKAIQILKGLGIKISEVQLPELNLYRAANFILLSAESYARHAIGLREHWEHYGKSARIYLAQGAFLSASDYIYARELAISARKYLDEVFERFDLLALPTSPFVTSEAAREPELHRRGIGTSFTAPFNLSGHPAISLPSGMSPVGLPLGFQLIASYFNETLIFQVGCEYEAKTDWYGMHPAQFT